jgi:hypothetical protein
MVVAKIGAQSSTQAVFVKDDHVVETLPADGSNDSLDVSTLPRRSGSAENLFDIHHVDLPAEIVSIDSIAIPQQIFRRSVKWKRLNDLLGGPFCGRVSSKSLSRPI